VATEDPAQGRWERLFADLDAEADSAEWAALTALVADRARAEVGRIRFVDRLRGATGHPVECHLLGGATVAGVLRQVGPDWLLLGRPGGGEAVVALAAIGSVTGLGAYSAAPGSEGHVAARLDLRYALRRLARDRSPLTVVLSDGATLTGTLDRVGADFVELAEHPADEARRPRAIRGVRTVQVRALAVVRRST
jgi:small nuclear ribonucleoprotein (snRNP)-like protein